MLIYNFKTYLHATREKRTTKCATLSTNNKKKKKKTNAAMQ